MYFFSPPPILKAASTPWIYWNIKTPLKKIYLTFDDGPHPQTTQQILDILQDFESKATFFCKGENVNTYYPLLEKILDRGHACGNHTYSHISGWSTKTKNYLADIEKCASLVESNLFRPPFGKMSIHQMFALPKQYRIVMWTLMSYDFHENIDAQLITNTFLRKTKKGAIWVFHDNPIAIDKIKQTLPFLLEYFKNKGFTFDSLSEAFWPDSALKTTVTTPNH